MDSIHSNANSTVCTGTGIVNSTTREFAMGTLMKQAIINHPKYASLFSGVGHFRCSPIHITMRQNATPVQKPPRRVPIAMKDKFKEELDAMESQGIISKYDGHDINPEWLNSFVIVKNQMVVKEFVLTQPISIKTSSGQDVTHRQWMMLYIGLKVQNSSLYSIQAKGFFTFL